jgi:hypothetical protein
MALSISTKAAEWLSACRPTKAGPEWAVRSDVRLMLRRLLIGCGFASSGGFVQTVAWPQVGEARSRKPPAKPTSTRNRSNKRAAISASSPAAPIPAACRR